MRSCINKPRIGEPENCKRENDDQDGRLAGRRCGTDFPENRRIILFDTHEQGEQKISGKCKKDQKNARKSKEEQENG